jgi:hypothetical protein
LTRKPQREGYTLTEEGENLYSDWLDIGGCCCHTGCAPCSSCVSDGNPISLEEGDEYWEPDVVIKPDTPVFPEGIPFRAIYEDRGVYWDDDKSFAQQIAETEGGGMARDKIVNKSSVKDPPEFKVGYWYKCIEGNCIDVATGKSYRLITKSSQTKNSGKWDGYHGGVYLRDTRFDIHSESSFNPIAEVNIDRGTPENIIKAANHCVGVDRGTQLYYDSTGAVIVPKECEGIDLSKYPVRFKGVINSETVLTTVSTSINQQEESKMSNANNRRVLTVQVFDLDPALDVELSLVHVFKDVVTEDTNEVTLTELLHTGQLVVPLADHNKKRVAQDNKDILSRTGKKVKLEPVKVKNLSFKYV